MERWAGRVAVVTGASSGIGAAITKDLVRKGLIVVGLARRENKIQELAKDLEDAPGRLHAIHCDVTEEEDILASFKWIKENLGHVDVLVNNAGVFYETMLSSGNTDDWRKQIDVNVLGLAICTREMLKGRGDRDGHIIHINSVAGHYPPLFQGGGIYNATKHAVTALTENLRQELAELKSKVKVTSVSPGLVKTEIISRGNIHDTVSDMVFKTHPYLEPEDVSDAVLYVLGTPPRVQVCELHFSEDQILRHSDCYDSKTGKKYCIPLQKPRLKQGAVPTIMPNCPSYLSSASSCRESGDQRRERLENRDLETALAESLKTHAQYQEERNFTDFQGFLQCLPKIQLLDDWITVKSESNVSFVLLNTCNIPTLLASIVVKSDLTMSLHVGKMELTNLDNRKFPIALSNINDVTDSIFKLDKLGRLENQDFKDHFQFIKDCLMKLSELLEGEKSSLINFICEQLLLINVPKNHYSYSSDFLIFCSILFSISPHAYKFMRSSGYLILPHPNTLHKICSAYNTNPAMEQIDKNFLLYIRQKYKFLSVSDSIVSLMVDEIHLKPYLDYTGGNILGAAYNSSNAAASAQVFMIQSLLSSFKDVVHILPVKNLNGEGLFQFIKKVVSGLHTIGFKVICIVTDNNALNRRAMSFFASPPKLSIVYKHPCDENQPLFYVLDSVHILKCIRNNWLNQKDVDQSIMYPSFETFPQDTELAVAKFSAIKTLHDIESTQIVKYANRLNLKSLFPTNLERQNVKLVLNVFNEMTIQGLEALGESNSIANFQATATFIKLICTWWSIVNVGSPGRDVRFKDIYQKPLSNSSDENFMYLERFLCWLDFWKNLPNRASALSKETHLAISHTTHALLEITKYCTQELNFKYLLPGKIQTDALEARFGKYRTMAGSQYLISLRQVFEIESKIRIQTLLSLKIPSNAFGEIDLDLDLFECDLKLDDFEASPPDVDLYCVDISEEQLLSIQEYLPVITYLSGYCVRAILRRLKCEICKTSLVLDRTLSLTDDEGNYELIRNVDRGGLHCPNPEVVNAIIFTYLTVKTLISEKYENMFMKHPSQRNLVVALAMSVIRKGDVFFVELPCTQVDHTHEKILFYIVKTGCNIFLNNYVKKLNNVQSRTNTKKRKLNSLIG